MHDELGKLRSRLIFKLCQNKDINIAQRRLCCFDDNLKTGGINSKAADIKVSGIQDYCIIKS